MKATNARVMCKTIEKKCLSNELVSNLEQKIKKLEEDVLDTHEWDKLLLFTNPNLETNIDMSPFANQTTLQNNHPTHPTSNPFPSYPTSQNQPSSI